MSTDIGFHKVHDSNNFLLQNNSIARKMNGEDLHGTCFTNRNIRLGEQIYIRVIETHPKLSGSMDFGLTNYDHQLIIFINCAKTKEVSFWSTPLILMMSFVLPWAVTLSVCLSMMLFTKQLMLKPCQLEDMYGSLLTCSEK